LGLLSARPEFCLACGPQITPWERNQFEALAQPAYPEKAGRHAGTDIALGLQGAAAKLGRLMDAGEASPALQFPYERNTCARSLDN